MHSQLSQKFKLAFAACLIMLFSSCTQLGNSSNANVNFNLKLSRSARAVFKNAESAFVTAELKGGVEDSQTVTIKEKETVEFTFSEIPVGTELYAQIEIYINEKNAETEQEEKVVLYRGKSESKIIEEGNNELKITLEKLFEDKEEDEEEDEKEIKFNIVTKTDTTYTVENPTFIVKKTPLSTNEISFNLEKDYEEFLWQPADTNIKLNDYQKAIIT